MRKKVFLAAFGISLITGQTLFGQTGMKAVETHDTMVNSINPAMVAVSDVMERARSNSEELDPTLLNKYAWARLRSAAASLESSARQMGRARMLRVGAHTADTFGFANKAEIQIKLDASPARFRVLSRTMASRASALRAAVDAHDTRTLSDRVNELSESCQTCHTIYWEKP